MVNGLEKGGKTHRNSIERLFWDNRAFTAVQKVKQKATTARENAEAAEKKSDKKNGSESDNETNSKWKRKVENR